MTEDPTDLDPLSSRDFGSTPRAPELEICYLDDVLVVVNKPAGMLVHRSGMMQGDRLLMQTLRDQRGSTCFLFIDSISQHQVSSYLH